VVPTRLVESEPVALPRRPVVRGNSTVVTEVSVPT